MDDPFWSNVSISLLFPCNFFVGVGGSCITFCENMQMESNIFVNILYHSCCDILLPDDTLPRWEVLLPFKSEFLKSVAVEIVDLHFWR